MCVCVCVCVCVSVLLCCVLSFFSFFYIFFLVSFLLLFSFNIFYTSPISQLESARQLVSSSLPPPPSPLRFFPSSFILPTGLTYRYFIFFVTCITNTAMSLHLLHFLMTSISVSWQLPYLPVIAVVVAVADLGTMRGLKKGSECITPPHPSPPPLPLRTNIKRESKVQSRTGLSIGVGQDSVSVLSVLPIGSPLGSPRIHNGFTCLVSFHGESLLERVCTESLVRESLH